MRLRRRENIGGRGWGPLPRLRDTLMCSAHPFYGALPPSPEKKEHLPGALLHSWLRYHSRTASLISLPLLGACSSISRTSKSTRNVIIFWLVPFLEYSLRTLTFSFSIFLSFGPFRDLGVSYLNRSEGLRPHLFNNALIL